MKEPDLFGEIPWEPEDEWGGMPEFVSSDADIYAEIVVRFRNEADLKKFASLFGQKLYQSTNSAWFPKLEHGSLELNRGMTHKFIYKDES